MRVSPERKLMTNPNAIVRLHSRNAGRASVYEANMPYQIYDNGLLKGAGVVPASGLNVTVGGEAANPDVVIAETPDGYKIALDLAGDATLTLTAPSSNSKIVAIVAYADDLAEESTDPTTTGSPSSCGLIAVDGTVASTPVAPTDAQIRTAITADGATGSQAPYSIIALVTIASTTTDITSTLISMPKATRGVTKLMYPIGSYYETSDENFDPNIEFGGTWLEDTQGRVLVSADSGTFDTVGDTGGAETVSHRHWQSGGSDGDHFFDLSTSGIASEGLETRIAQKNRISLNAGSATTDGMRQSTTYNTTTSTLQPYIVVKRWHRTA